MKPISFKEQTVIIAEGQEEFVNLPAWTSETETISCWEFNWQERIQILLFGKVWLRIWNFNKPLQPQLLQTEFPFKKRDSAK